MTNNLSFIQIAIYPCNPLLLRNDLPSHPPDSVIEVVADDAASSLLIYSTVTGRAAVWPGYFDTVLITSIVK